MKSASLLSCCLIFLVEKTFSTPQGQQQGYGAIQDPLNSQTPFSQPDIRRIRKGDLSPRKVVPAPAYDQQLQDLTYEPANYDFKYQIHGGGNFYGHEESRREHRAQGSYHVLLPDGRRQVVTYYADETGYHPTITYEFVGVPDVQNSLTNNNNNAGYRSKRSRSYRHSKRVSLQTPMIFFKSSQ